MARNEVMAVVPVPREVWERADEIERAMLLRDVAGSLISVAAQAAAERHRIPTAIVGKAEVVTPEQEPAALFVGDPAEWLVVRQRFATRAA